MFIFKGHLVCADLSWVINYRECGIRLCVVLSRYSFLLPCRLNVKGPGAQLRFYESWQYLPTCRKHSIIQNYTNIFLVKVNLKL